MVVEEDSESSMMDVLVFGVCSFSMLGLLL